MNLSTDTFGPTKLDDNVEEAFDIVSISVGRRLRSTHYREAVEYRTGNGQQTYLTPDLLTVNAGSS